MWHMQRQRHCEILDLLERACATLFKLPVVQANIYLVQNVSGQICVALPQVEKKANTKQEV